MKYEFRELDESTVQSLIALSKQWQEENCSCGIVVNTAKDLSTPLCVALDNGEIVGYIFGHYYVAERRASYIEIGSKCFSVDELYVRPEYRSRGIGKELFRRMEQVVKNDCTYISLSTSTKDHKRILHFYVDELNMDFHSAFLIKSVENIPV